MKDDPPLMAFQPRDLPCFWNSGTNVTVANSSSVPAVDLGGGGEGKGDPRGKAAKSCRTQGFTGCPGPACLLPRQDRIFALDQQGWEEAPQRTG